MAKPTDDMTTSDSTPGDTGEKRTTKNTRPKTTRSKAAAGGASSTASKNNKTQKKAKPAPKTSAGKARPTKSKSTKRASSERKRQKPEPVRVVAIGASAGGLEPIEQFFDAMPADTGLAFVVIQHLSPDFRSMMDQLLARHSTMVIKHAQHGAKVEANVVYLNPPRNDLTIKNGKLHSREHSNSELPSLPIDSFLYSLAEDQKDKAIGVIMSGTGSDGSRGAQAIREAGGTVIVQDPRSAKFDSMPRAAIGRDTASISALPEEIPSLLRQLIEGKNIERAPLDAPEDDDPERQILNLLQRRYDADFGYYKEATVRRRIRRRALLNQINSIDRYAEKLKDDTEELEALYCDLLIGVTAFFRDKEAFSLMEKEILPELVSAMSKERPLRVWVPGCASGEEPYSIAMLICEFAEKHGLPLNLKVFATDLHFNSLDIASAGNYSKESLRDVPPELLEKYFDRMNDRYQVKQPLRKLIVFSPHNLIKDPPFTRMDLVSCRNLLIYLDDVAQRKVLAMFHFALRKDGVLFLGPSESTGPFEDEFETVSKKWRIFSKKRDVRLRESTELLPLSSTDQPQETSEVRVTETRATTLANLQAAAAQRQTLLRAYDRVLDRFAPPSLLTDRNGELIHIFGDATKYLALKGGIFTKKVVEIINPDLQLVVSAGIERVLAQNKVPFERKTTIRLEDGEESTVVVNVERLATEGSYAEFLLVSIDAHEAPSLPIPPIDENIENDNTFLAQRVMELERDLKVTEESLQSTIEELETSNEELQATNEELMASNEELQSTNEELHSVNEELYTVSAEHQRKIEELTELTDDMENLLRATDIGTIFLDSQLNIRRFTPAAATTFNLVNHDIGRPLEHITYRFAYDGLVRDVESVRSKGGTVVREIEVDGRFYILRVLPYQSNREESSGAVVTVVDIQEMKEAQHEIAEQKKLYEQVVQEQRELIVRMKPDTKITFLNDAFCRFFQKSREDLLGTRAIELVPKPEQKDILKVIANLGPEDTNESEREDIRPDGTRRWLHLVRQPIVGQDGAISEIQVVGRDITSLKKAQLELEDVNNRLKIEEARLDQIYRNSPVMQHSILEDGTFVGVSDHWLKKMGYERDEVIGRSIYEFMTEESSERMKRENIEKLFGGGAVDNVQYTYIRKDKSLMEIRLSAIAATGVGTERLQSFSVAFDVTDQVEAERRLEEQNAELARINENLNQFAHIVSHDLTGPLRAIEHTTLWIEEDAPEQARQQIQEHIVRLKDQVTHLSSMLGDLLDYSRAGESASAAESFDLAKAIKNIFDVIEKPEKFRLEIESAPKKLVAVRAPLLLVFRNLIENAIKYNDLEDGRVTVSSEDQGDKWLFSVEDDGPGIDPNFHDKILLPFRKLERKDKAPGNGMGLALVKKAIETNGGELTIMSNPLEKPGTTFSFTWPKKWAQSKAA